MPGGGWVLSGFELRSPRLMSSSWALGTAELLLWLGTQLLSPCWHGAEPRF